MATHARARWTDWARTGFAATVSAILLAGAAMAGCTRSVLLDVPIDVEAPPQPPTGAETTASIGAAGGELRLGDLVLSIPAGAVASATPITIRVEADPGVSAPAGFRSFSPIYRFEPAGLEFALPVRIDLPFSGNGEIATIFWTQPGSTDTYTALPTTTLGYRARTDITHFSQGFVGTTSGCTDGNCCRRASGQLDVLFVVDNSGSMTEEQASLAMELPRLVRAVVTGDANDDGVQDFPAAANLHVGVVTTDMGVAGFNVPTCTLSPMFGDDGLLRTDGNTSLAGCMALYPRFLAYEAGISPRTPEEFGADFRCVAAAGTGGCGFEQQLEAALKALTPSTSSTTFVGGTRGHGSDENAGFLRADAALAVIVVTDEEDCSVATGFEDIFNQMSATYTGDLNLRCFLYKEAQYAIARYVDGLLALKDDPSLIVFAPVVGIPTDLAGATYDTMLSDPRLIERVDTSPGATGARLVPSCEVPGRGIAFPPRRIVDTARDLAARGARAPVQSICQENFYEPITAVLGAIQGSLSGTCE